MTADVVIRGGTVVDGTGAPGRRRRRRHHRRRHHRDRRRASTGRRELDAVGPDRHARLRRHPHPLRRAGLLGPGADAELLARRHVGRRRQLRLLDRAGPARAPRAARPHAAARRGHVARHARSPACRGTSSRRSRSTSTRSSARGTLLNYACYVGHTAVRIFVMGEAGYERAATDDEIARDADRSSPRRWPPARPGFATLVVADAQRRPRPAGAVARRRPRRAATRCSSRCATPDKGVAALLPGEKVTHADVFELQRAIGRPLTWTALLTVKGYPWHEKIMAANDAGPRRGHRGVAAGVVPAARRSR